MESFVLKKSVEKKNQLVDNLNIRLGRETVQSVPSRARHGCREKTDISRAVVEQEAHDHVEICSPVHTRRSSFKLSPQNCPAPHIHFYDFAPGRGTLSPSPNLRHCVVLYYCADRRELLPIR